MGSFIKQRSSGRFYRALVVSIALVGIALAGGMVPHSGTSAASHASVSTPIAQQQATPTITAAPTITLRQGETRTAVVATVASPSTPVANLRVTLTRVLTQPTATPLIPISIIGITVPSATGQVSATIESRCDSTPGTYTYELVVNDGSVLGARPATLTVTCQPSFTAVVPANTKVRLRRVITAQFRPGDNDSGALPLTGVDTCNNVSFRFERDDTRYARRLVARDDSAFFTVVVVNNTYQVRYTPSIPRRVTATPSAVDVVPDKIRTRLTILGPNGQPLAGTNPVIVTGRVATGLRLFDDVTFSKNGDSVTVTYNVWDADLNSGDYQLAYTFFDESGGTIGSTTAQTSHLQDQVVRAFTGGFLNRGQTFRVTQTFDGFGVNRIASIGIRLSDGSNTQNAVAAFGAQPDDNPVDVAKRAEEGKVPTIALPAFRLNLEK